VIIGVQVCRMRCAEGNKNALDQEEPSASQRHGKIHDGYVNTKQTGTDDS